MKKVYEGDYDRSEFYSIMGKFFAEKQYKKELPYIENNDKKSWCLFYRDNKLAGFYAYSKEKNSVVISNFFVISEYRLKGLAKSMINDSLNIASSIQYTTNNPYMIKMLKGFGFYVITEKGSYLVMRRERND